LLCSRFLRWLRRQGQALAREQPVDAIRSNHGIPEAAGNQQQRAEGRHGRTIRRPAAVNDRPPRVNGRNPRRLERFLECIGRFSVFRWKSTVWKSTVAVRSRNEL
jgi:hypothetical protein